MGLFLGVGTGLTLKTKRKYWKTQLHTNVTKVRRFFCDRRPHEPFTLLVFAVLQSALCFRITVTAVGGFLSLYIE